MLQLHPLGEPLSKGVGLFDLLSSSSRLTLCHLCSSRPAQGRIYSKHLALTTKTAVSSVGARATLPRCAPERDNPRGRVSAEMIRTRARNKLCRSGKAESFSPA